jgi:hypothetical protein
LGELSRKELKGVCRALGLDDSGRAKADIAARIFGSGATLGVVPAGQAVVKGVPEAAAAEQNVQMRKRISRGSGDGGTKPNGDGEVTAVVNGRLTLGQLESHLWGPADILPKHIPKQRLNI